MLSRIGPEPVLADSGLPCDTFNFVCRARLGPETTAAAARETISHFTRVGRPFSWWVGPGDRPSELGSVLEGLGLERAEDELAMAVPLDRVREPSLQVPSLGFEAFGGIAEYKPKSGAGLASGR